MVLFVVGLGLGDEKDISVKGLEAVRSCDKVYLENYTSILGVDTEKLESFYDCKIVLADRDCVELEADSIMQDAKELNIAFLVVGDPYCATTHVDFILRARDMGIKVEVIHNASVMGAAGACGLQLYTFGQTVSIPFFREEWRPDSFYKKIQYNRQGGMHTLCLLDIKVKEPDFEAMCQGRKRFLPPRYMSINVAIEQLLEIEAKHDEKAYTKDTICVGMARLGQPDQLIRAGRMEELLTYDFGAPLHALAIVGDLHCLEEEMLEHYMISNHTAGSDAGSAVP